MLHTACRLVLNEVTLPGSAPGGKVEFKRTLIISFLFKFYLEVCQSLKRMVSGVVVWTVMSEAEAPDPAEDPWTGKDEKQNHILLMVFPGWSRGWLMSEEGLQRGHRPAQGFA